jgi:glycosyltransferase involved in cell wall biosynthesis
VRTISLRARVAAVAVAAIVVAFVLLAVAVPALLERQLTNELDRSLRGRAIDVARLASATPALGDRVHFHGALAEPEVAALLDRADLFVLPSIVARDGFMEGIPVALMEALASGVPVVATRLSGVPELVRDGDTEPDGSRRRAAAGRELVEREFDAGAGAQRMAELLRGDS